MEFLTISGITLDTVGTILIAYTALRVHYRVRREHRIDERVTREMGHELGLGIAGVVLVIAGYALQLIGHIV